MKTTMGGKKFSGLIFFVTIASFILTGCSSTRSGTFSEASGSPRMTRNYSRAKVGNLVALKHDGKTIYVNDEAVASHLSRGDTLAINEDGKTVYGDERELQEYLSK